MFTSYLQAASFRRKYQRFLKYDSNALPSPLLCFCSTYSHYRHLGGLHWWQFPSHFFVCSVAVVLLRSQCFAYMISWDSLNSLSQKTAILAVNSPCLRGADSSPVRSACLALGSQPCRLLSLPAFAYPHFSDTTAYTLPFLQGREQDLDEPIRKK